MKRKLALFLALITAVSLLAGCSQSGGASSGASQPAASGQSESSQASSAGAEAEAEPVSFVFWVNDGSTQWMDVWGTAASDYMAENPNVTIEVVGIPWDSSATKFNTAAATDTLPDLAHLAPQNLSPMMAQDKVVNLQPYFDEYEGKDDLSSAHVAYFQQFDPKKPGLWMAPMFGSDKQMWYRADWFEEAGIEFPETWDEWFDVVAQMTTDEHAGYSFRGGPGGWDLLIEFLMPYTDSDTFFDENGQSFFNKEKAVEGVTRWVDIYLNGQTPDTALANGYTEMIAEFAAGNAAMAWHHLQSETLITEKMPVENLGYGWIPKNENGRRIKKADAQGVVMFTSCAEEKRDAAWDYIEFLWTPEQQLQMIEKGGGVPTNLKTDVSSKPFVEEALKQAADSATVGVIYPEYLPDWTAFTTEEMQADLQALMLQEMEPADAVAKWAEKCDAMYAEYQAE